MFSFRTPPCASAGFSARVRVPISLLILTSVFAAACDTSSSIEPEELPAALQISANLDILQGETSQAVATVVGKSGKPIASPGAGKPKDGGSASITWSTTDPEIASISDEGVVFAELPGSTTITALSGNLRGSAQLVVRGNGKAVQVSPSEETLESLGQTLQLRATVLDAKGYAVKNPNVNWRSLRPEVANVDNGGKVVSLKPGIAPIVATAQGRADTAVISVNQVVVEVAMTALPEVLAIGDTVRLRATARDARGFTVEGAKFQWASSSTAVATVSSSGLVRGVTTGTATVSATTAAETDAASAGTQELESGLSVASASVSTTSSSSKSVKGTTAVTVGGKKDSSSLVVAPKTDTLNALNQTRQLGVTVRDAQGKVVTNPNVTWTSLHPAIATVDAMGRVTSKAVGLALITAVSGTLADTARVQVRQVPAKVTVSPTSVSLAAGETVQISASAADSSGVKISNATFSWRSSNTNVASVSTAGAVKGVAGGSALITATSGDAATSLSASVSGAATPPPPSGAKRPNEPKGFARWLEHDFSCIPGNDGCNLIAGYAGGSTGGKYSIVKDPSDPTGGGTVVRIAYPTGHKDGNSPGRFWAWNNKSQAAATPLKEWYVSLWIMLESSAFEMPPANLKLWYNGVGRRGSANSGGSIHLYSSGVTTNNLATEFRTRFTARVSRDAVITNYGDQVSPERVFKVGRWHHIEFYGSLSTPGVANGVYRMWIDGRLVNERRNIQNQHPDDWTTGFYEFHWSPTWGGSCSTACPKTRDDFMRVAHLYVSGIPQ